MVTENIDEFGVDALWESRMVFKVRADLFEVQAVHVVLLE